MPKQPFTHKAKKQQPEQDRKPKRRTGKPAGTRNNVTPKKAEQLAKAPRDPRLGSKKAVPLVVEKSEAQPKAKYFSPAAELKSIEQDTRLDALMDRLDAGDKLSAEEQRYVDSKLARHQELCQLMGIDPEAEQDDDDDLLDKFEKINLDQFKK
ncbi:Der GTPase-activating protein YihI [Bowmanella yangjiangensis]|uniref:Der GTPase-activating protein YihI n=1 Tax=Bowmanella yangjiangensis TaxID=2811230 RepID=A0ABS3CXJ4_9ALTE|nr:Der GTPase-activating protein YihI [Bowmanella yangjiangensis]MBN7821840.1 GTPase-activating protein [Bowmanella yangjiangensis]